MRERFDKKFGGDFLAQIPSAPGVYRMYDRAGALIYVGKAKDLRKRLSQYRNAGPERSRKKMRALVRSATRIVVEQHESELDACLAEIRLIQAHRPKRNVEFAYEFLYPFIGVAADGSLLRWCLTTVPEQFEGYELHGAYRSRDVTGTAFFAMMRLFGYLGHAQPRRTLGADADKDYSYVFEFRQLPAQTRAGWTQLLRGASDDALADTAVALLDKVKARSQSSEVEADLLAVDTFYREQARPLRLMADAANHVAWPVAAAARDPLQAMWRLREAQSEAQVSA
ncbi:nucleotide excision repair endonuclease [Enhygromyxa salina]|uniref:UvrABC system protein C n=1 Tax=Enhygromyxa salina TaxID=215803 RepID=A0A2S9Y4D7_9BACT|nr:nucleotide excision repair endonuclease [Enhygromyxa salina]PRP99963.1 UvrABC system protein C [Enhygromyxa salina]